MSWFGERRERKVMSFYVKIKLTGNNFFYHTLSVFTIKTFFIFEITLDGVIIFFEFNVKIIIKIAIIKYDFKN